MRARRRSTSSTRLSTGELLVDRMSGPSRSHPRASASSRSRTRRCAALSVHSQKREDMQHPSICMYEARISITQLSRGVQTGELRRCGRPARMRNCAPVGHQDNSHTSVQFHPVGIRPSPSRPVSTHGSLRWPITDRVTGHSSCKNRHRRSIRDKTGDHSSPGWTNWTRTFARS